MRTAYLFHFWKAMMEEIAGFEDRLNDLKTKGDNLISQCADHLQAKLKQTYTPTCRAQRTVIQPSAQPRG